MDGRPWKVTTLEGDFHHDLNTQLSYWPAYASNQLQLEEGYLNWLWDVSFQKQKGLFWR